MSKLIEAMEENRRQEARSPLVSLKKHQWNLLNEESMRLTLEESELKGKLETVQKRQSKIAIEMCGLMREIRQHETKLKESDGQPRTQLPERD